MMLHGSSGGAGKSRVRWGISFERLSVALLFIALIGLAAVSPPQNDTFWALRAGADIWRTGAVPRVDHYSFTAVGAPWPDHEWLWQVILYGVYWLGGMPALEILAVLLIVGGIAIGYRLMVGTPGTRIAIIVLTVPAASWNWALRPLILTVFLLMVLLWLLVRDRHWPIPLLFLFWANAHGAVMLGGVVLVVATAVAILRWRVRRGADDRRRAIALAIAGPLAALATSATPLGFGIFRMVAESTERAYAVPIDEWFPASPTELMGALFWPVALGFLVLVVVRRRVLALRSWGDWVAVGAALALTPFAFRSARNISPFLMLAAPAASRLLGADFRLRAPRENREPSRDHPTLNLALLVALAGVVALLLGSAWAYTFGPRRWRPIPDRALAAVRACPGPLYNQYNQGGELIWFVPEKPVFIDGRYEPYSTPFLREAFAVESGEKPHRPLFDRWGIRCAFLPTNSQILGALDKEGWTTTYRDANWVVLRQPDANAR